MAWGVNKENVTRFKKRLGNTVLNLYRRVFVINLTTLIMWGICLLKSLIAFPYYFFKLIVITSHYELKFYTNS